ncbi:HNH endonuclease [bacterium]|nr:HNH endonuclease [bacterium]
MKNSIISYIEMCQMEKNASLQRGMNYELGGDYSVILMSIRANAPYKDSVEDDGRVLIYEGHDHPRSPGLEPKLVNQPRYLPSGRPTQNGRFFQAAKDFADNNRDVHRVKVYEKLKKGIWADNGLFDLIDAWIENDERRDVFKFKLRVSDNQRSIKTHRVASDSSNKRIIPTHVKLEVMKRDKGKCVICGAQDELHFDHDIPFSKGGTSVKAENIQILCARHNLSKSDNIQ